MKNIRKVYGYRFSGMTLSHLFQLPSLHLNTTCPWFLHLVHALMMRMHFEWSSKPQSPTPTASPWRMFLTTVYLRGSWRIQNSGTGCLDGGTVLDFRYSSLTDPPRYKMEPTTHNYWSCFILTSRYKTMFELLLWEIEIIGSLKVVKNHVLGKSLAR